MKHPFLVGNRIYLRPLEESDLNGDYFDWLNDYEVTRYMYTASFPNSMEKMRSFFESAQQQKDNIILAIVDKKTDKHIGNIRLGPINWIHRRSDFGIMIGNKKYWGKNIGYEATRLFVAYAFDRLNLHKVLLGVVAEQKKAIKLYKRIGFKTEGIGVEQFYCDGRYLDAVYMGLLAKDFRKASR